MDPGRAAEPGGLEFPREPAARALRRHPGALRWQAVQRQPRGRIDLQRITARLVGKEVVVSGSGTNRTTHTHELHESTVIAHEVQAEVSMES